MPFGRNRYVAALERRVKELEGFLAKRDLLHQVSTFTPYDFSDAPLSAPNGEIPQREHETRLEDRPQTGSSRGGSDDQSSDHEDSNSMVRILRDLSLESNGGYMGATSHLTMGRLVGSIVHVKRTDLEQNQHSQLDVHHPRILEKTRLDLSEVEAWTAENLLRGYMKHVATRYPVLQSTWIRELSLRRDRLNSVYERCVLHVVYAIAGRFLETTGETSPNFSPERHQAEAYRNLEDILDYHDTRSVVTLLLLAVLSLRAEGGPGAWAFVGLAMVRAS